MPWVEAVTTATFPWNLFAMFTFSIWISQWITVFGDEGFQFWITLRSATENVSTNFIYDSWPTKVGALVSVALSTSIYFFLTAPQYFNIFLRAPSCFTSYHSTPTDPPSVFFLGGGGGWILRFWHLVTWQKDEFTHTLNGRTIY